MTEKFTKLAAEIDTNAKEFLKEVLQAHLPFLTLESFGWVPAKAVNAVIDALKERHNGVMIALTAASIKLDQLASTPKAEEDAAMIRHLKAKVAHLESHNELLAGSLEAANQKKDQFKKQMYAAMYTPSNATEELQTEQAVNVALRTEVRNYEHLVKSLKHSLEHRSNVISSLNDTVGRLRSKVTAVCRNNNELMQRESQQRAVIDKLQTDKDVANAKIDETANVIKIRDGQLASLHQMNSNQATSINELLNKLTTIGNISGTYANDV
jgi:chromosome segregation ATPase